MFAYLFKIAPEMATSPVLDCIHLFIGICKGTRLRFPESIERVFHTRRRTQSQPHAAAQGPVWPRKGCGIKQMNFSGAEPGLRNWCNWFAGT